MPHFMLADTQQTALLALRARAEAAPIDYDAAKHLIKTADGRAAYAAQLRAQSLRLMPDDFLVFFSIEAGHRLGQVRHMSVSAPPGGLPHPEAIWIIARLLGYEGEGVEACDLLWPEQVPGRGIANNLVQFFATAEMARWTPE